MMMVWVLSYFLPVRTQFASALMTAWLTVWETILPFVMDREWSGSGKATVMPVPAPLSAALYAV